MSELRPSEPLIQFRSVRKAFGDQTVLDGVDLTIERGGVTTIIGAAGVARAFCSNTWSACSNRMGGPFSTAARIC